jgi:hypothetical protein
MGGGDSLASTREPSGANSFAPSTRNDGSSAQRYALLALLLVIAALSWASLAWDYPSFAMNMMLPYSMGLSLTPFLLIWVVMMVAMMFPTAAPMILTFHKIQRRKTGRGTFFATWAFVAGYLVLWALTGVAAFALARGAEAAAAFFAVSASSFARIGGAVLMLAGIYQFTPAKNFCLSKCRTPIAFLLARGNGRRLADGLAARPILLWMLLAPFRDSFPARHDERRGDGGDHLAHPCRENVSKGQVDSARVRRRSYRLWRRGDRYAGAASDIFSSVAN